jgi:transcriptional regulator with XRE-family HTH domain
MPSQFPAFRLTVAQQMQPKALRERVGRRIRAARLKEGLEPRDLAYRLHVDERTLERWEGGEVYPQLRNRKALAESLELLSLDDLQPDLEAEERELRDQLDRIEETVNQLENKLDLVLDGGAPRRVAEAVTKGARAKPATPERRPRRSRAKAKKSAGG